MCYRCNCKSKKKHSAGPIGQAVSYAEKQHTRMGRAFPRRDD